MTATSTGMGLRNPGMIAMIILMNRGVPMYLVDPHLPPVIELPMIDMMMERMIAMKQPDEAVDVWAQRMMKIPLKVLGGPST